MSNFLSKSEIEKLNTLNATSISYAAAITVAIINGSEDNDNLKNIDKSLTSLIKAVESETMTDDQRNDLDLSIQYFQWMRTEVISRLELDR